MSDQGYVNYFEVLGVPADCKAGEVKRTYKKKMKELVNEIARTKLTEEARDRYLLRMAQLNAAFYILRDNARREQYVHDRDEVIELEDTWRQAAGSGAENAEKLRRQFDGAVRHFLSVYTEELILEAGRDQDCVEASNWDLAHERHASSVLRHHRQRRYHEIHERLPFVEVTRPEVDWEERQRTVSALLDSKEV